MGRQQASQNPSQPYFSAATIFSLSPGQLRRAYCTAHSAETPQQVHGDCSSLRHANMPQLGKASCGESAVWQMLVLKRPRTEVRGVQGVHAQDLWLTGASALLAGPAGACTATCSAHMRPQG